MANFDAKAAKAAGYSDEEIAKVQQGISAAKTAGYSDQEIQEFLGGAPSTSSAPQTSPPSSQGQIPPVPASTPPLTQAPPSFLSTLGREATIAGAGLVQGVHSSLALPGQLIGLGEKYLPSPSSLEFKPPELANLFANKNPDPSLSTPFDSRNLGPTPEGTGENLLSAGAQGLGAAALTLPLGGYGAMARTLGAGIGGGLSGEAAKEFFPNSTVAPVVAGAVGGLAAGGLAGLGQGSRLEGVAKSLGESSTMQQAGSELQSAVRDWKSNVLPMKLEALRAPLDAKMAANPEVDLSELDKTLHSMTTAAGKGQPLSDVVISSLPKALAAKLQSLGGPQVTTPSGQTFTLPSIPYEDARVVRSDLGDLLANPSLIPGRDISKVKAIYGALSSDIGKTAEAAGAKDEWEAFNKGSNELYRIAEGPMSKVSSDVNPANETILPENAATKLLTGGKKGGTDLQDLRKEIPGALDELAAGLIRSSPQLLPKLSPEAQSALVFDPKARAAIDSIAGMKPEPFAPVTHIGQAIAGGAVGERAGDLLAQSLHLAQVPPQALGLAAMAAPMAFRGARNLLANPEKGAFPLVGAVSGNAGGQKKNPLSQ